MAIDFRWDLKQYLQGDKFVVSEAIFDREKDSYMTDNIGEIPSFIYLLIYRLQELEARVKELEDG